MKHKTDNIVDVIPDWHKEILEKRMQEYMNEPSIAEDFDAAMDEIEKELED